MIFLLFLTAFFDGTFSDEKLKKTVNMLEEVNLLIQTSKSISCQNEGGSPSKCADITDQFCDKLWNKENKGNLKVFDGEIKAGKSLKSEVALVQLEDDKAFISSIDKLPSDMKKKFAPLAAKLKTTLRKENKKDEWFEEYSSLRNQIEDGIDDLTDQKLKKEFPKIDVDSAKDWTLAEHVRYNQIYWNYHDTLTKAKYEKHPNWQRVETLFPKIQASMLKTIQSLKIPDEEKNKMKDKVSHIKLSLPLMDPLKSDSDKDCASTKINAFYHDETNTFVVCAGFFNGYQSESALAQIIGHEMGHSIDASALAASQWREKSPVAQALKKLAHTEGNAYTCDEWIQLKKDVLKPKPNQFQLHPHPLEKLFSCLRGNAELKTLGPVQANLAAHQKISELMSKYAEDNDFSNFLKPKVAGKTNESFMSPRNFYLKENSVQDDQIERTGQPPEIFVQSFRCQMEFQGLNTHDLDETKNIKISAAFAVALEETFEIEELSSQDYFQYCGKNCPNLESFGLAENPDENVADWYSNKSFPEYLNGVAPEHRSEASALSVSLFCSDPDNQWVSDDLTKIEKKYSLEPHADDRVRRTSLYTSEISQMVGCEGDSQDQGFSQCQP